MRSTTNERSELDNHVTRLDGALDPATTETLRKRVETTIRQLREDYFPQHSDLALHCDHLRHTSLVMKIAAYRFFDDEVFRILRDAVEARTQELYRATQLLLHPIFYLRISVPGVCRSELHRAAFLDSEPHYDRSYGVHAYTFWLALEDVDDESGGLATFDDPAIDRHFRTDGRNRYNYNNYLDAAATLDPLLCKSTKTLQANAGDILTFDSNHLHGATKPRTRRRMSFDFRLAPADAVAAAPSSVRRIFAAINQNVSLSNARNLAKLGDKPGA